MKSINDYFSRIELFALYKLCDEEQRKITRNKNTNLDLSAIEVDILHEHQHLIFILREKLCYFTQQQESK